MPCICFSDFYCHARQNFLKQRGVPHKKPMSHVTYPGPATTRIRPGTNDRVPGSGSRQNSLPVPPICRQATCCHISSSLLYIAVLTTQNYHRLIQVFQMFIFVNRCSRCTRCSFCSVGCHTNYKLQASLQQCTVHA